MSASSHLRGFPDLPPVWALGLYLAQQACAAWVPLVRYEAGPAGIVMAAAGLALILWSAVWFWRKRTPIEPHHTPRALIVEGPYRLNRNPIYTGLALVLVGTGLNAGALSSLLLSALFPPLITRRFVLKEEAALRAAFGAAADTYIANSRRW
ncbi:methyltransferase family protein [Jannaschia aquimarina]|uniref:Isoprenylcysteine carboxyl methyltransferase (ICMT) family protein n=1 Tax=Jannaschia aquimarina TaxID=935700 RepID=A0A0D1EN60_9RHOB|nr:methyltransferase [Jannaschia aquimarina]KIT17135.1 hypothetical protein jaqu_10970 [Jannaschia aquimarina]SNT30061.1 Protein-S-isoprenylcysteine O-methyltransferase Ste14 [Jannaschia aquimarina]